MIQKSVITLLIIIAVAIITAGAYGVLAGLLSIGMAFLGMATVAYLVREETGKPLHEVYKDYQKKDGDA